MEVCSVFPLTKKNPINSNNKFFPFKISPFFTSGSRSLQRRTLLIPRVSFDENKYGNARLNFECGTQNWDDYAYTKTEDFSQVNSLQPDDHTKEFCLPVQTLHTFPREELHGKCVMLRVDSKLFLSSDHTRNGSALHTLSYLCNAGAKVLVTFNAQMSSHNSKFQTIHLLQEYLCAYLGKKVLVLDNVFGGHVEHIIGNLHNGEVLLLENLSLYREEVANSLEFARKLSNNVDILVNDSFSDSHRILASTVGVARFTYARIAGFYLMEMLCLFAQIIEKSKHPFTAIIGGAKILEKKDALVSLLHRCDVVAFTGIMSFTLLSASGVPISSFLIEHNGVEVAKELLCIAKRRSVKLLLPKDYWCLNGVNGPEEMQLLESRFITEGWKPVDIGPVTVNEIASALSECKMALWISPVRVSSSRHELRGGLKLVSLMNRFSEKGLATFALGKEVCNLFKQTCVRLFVHLVYEHGAASWELFKGKKLAGVAALDRAYPKVPCWASMFQDPSKPLVVDIGSGNGIFLCRMSEISKHWNFLGIEINEKLVKRSKSSLKELGLMNGQFVHADAATSFRPLICSYPGVLILVCIQCPDPDFVDPEHRWRMVQQSLVDAIVEKLCVGGKIFLQSDVKSVAQRIKDQFLCCEKGKISLSSSMENTQNSIIDSDGWLMQNPFGVCSDWEKHAVARGDTMYRILLEKFERSRN